MLARYMADAGGKSGGEGGKGGGKEVSVKNLNQKTFTHMRDNKLSGKDGGKGWVSFFEDMMVALGSVDKRLKATVTRIVDLKKDMATPEEAKEAAEIEWET